MDIKFSRRYTCQFCGYKGRVNKMKRGPEIKCPVCKEITIANIQN